MKVFLTLFIVIMFSVEGRGQVFYKSDGDPETRYYFHYAFSNYCDSMDKYRCQMKCAGKDSLVYYQLLHDNAIDSASKYLKLMFGWTEFQFDSAMSVIDTPRLDIKNCKCN